MSDAPPQVTLAGVLAKVERALVFTAAKADVDRLTEIREDLRALIAAPPPPVPASSTRSPKGGA